MKILNFFLTLLFLVGLSDISCSEAPTKEEVEEYISDFPEIFAIPPITVNQVIYDKDQKKYVIDLNFFDYEGGDATGDVDWKRLKEFLKQSIDKHKASIKAELEKFCCLLGSK